MIPWNFLNKGFIKKLIFKIQPERFLNLFLIFGEKFSLVSFKLVSYKKNVYRSRCPRQKEPRIWLKTFSRRTPSSMTDGSFFPFLLSLFLAGNFWILQHCGDWKKCFMVGWCNPWEKGLQREAASERYSEVLPFRHSIWCHFWFNDMVCLAPNCFLWFSDTWFYDSKKEKNRDLLSVTKGRFGWLPIPTSHVQ